MSEAQISVVIPAYNQARFLRQTLDSVLQQTTTAQEIIVVDDGSTDETAAVVATYGDRVCYLYQPNAGLAAARNTGILAANGRYVALLDSDDWWEPTLLSELLALAEREPASVVWYCGVRYVDEQGSHLPQASSVGVVPAVDCRRAFLRGNFIVPSATLLDRATLLAVGLFDTDYRRLQDWELWVRLVLQGYTLAGVARPLVNYRIHGNSLSTDPSGGQRAAMALAVKHFGSDDGAAMTPEKAHHYAGVYLYHAITSALARSNDWQSCAHWLANALRCDPGIVDDATIFYEIALGAQPLGWRGTAQHLTLAANFLAIEQMLSVLVKESTFQSHLQARKVQGMVWFAAGRAAYNTRQMALCRQAWRRVRWLRPTLLFKRATLRATLIAHLHPLRNLLPLNRKTHLRAAANS